jgi:hypothetical protein
MNLLKIQDALKNASDDQLMQLMQAPDSSAPSYLVLSEIRRRKDMRAQQPQEPQGTVAEDLASIPQTYDQAGIRSLRTPGYEEEERASPDDMQEMREGGVVRMQAGGMAEDFGLLPESEALPSSPFFERFRRFREETQRLREANQPASQLPRGDGEFGEERPIEGETRYTPGPSAGIPPIPDYTPEPMGGRQVYQTPAGPAAPSAGGGAGGGGAAGIPGAGAGGGSFEDGVLGGMRRLEAAFPNNLAALRAELEKGRTNPQERRREAQNLALVEAGLRMAASRNPSFLGSIGEGATPAVQSYAQQLGQIRQDERQDIRDRFSLEQANLQRMYALGQISAAEYRSRVAEAGANARSNAMLASQEARERAQASALEARERIAGTNAEAAANRANVTAYRSALSADGEIKAIGEQIGLAQSQIASVPEAQRGPIAARVQQLVAARTARERQIAGMFGINDPLGLR